MTTFDELYESYKLVTENSAPRSYSCLMLDCKTHKKELKAIQSNIDKADIYDDEEGHGLETEPHITVLYGIHEQDPEKVKKKLNLFPVTYTFTKLSLFENEKYDVLKCSVESDDLKELNKQCTDNLDYTNSYPDYIPHMTVAYLLPGTGKKYTSIKSPMFGDESTSNKFIFSNKDSDKVRWTLKS